MTDSATWPQKLPATQVQIVRRTTDLRRIVAFYRDGVGLTALGQFTTPEGFAAAMFGLPSSAYYLTFIQRVDKKNLPRPHEDDLLVLYIPDKQAIGRLTVKLGALGHFPVATSNPYWNDIAVTIEDPDGYRLVLCETEGLSS